MKRYIGERHGNSGLTRVLVDNGKVRAPLEHYVRHSPTGFEWGYGGSGPSDLARCILIDFLDCHTDLRGAKVEGGKLQAPGTTEDARLIEGNYQDFKFEIIAKFDRDSFELTDEEIEAWLRGRER